MITTFREARLDNECGVWLCLKVDDPSMARNFILDKQNRLYDVEIKQHRERRSLDANAYYWKLCGALASATHQTPDEVYLRHIRDVGNYEVLCMLDRAVPEFDRMWKSDHLGRFIETRASKIPDCTTVLAYYGSRDFDKRQMSILIDNCIQDCKAVGIETLPPDRLEAMKEEWRHA